MFIVQSWLYERANTVTDGCINAVKLKEVMTAVSDGSRFIEYVLIAVFLGLFMSLNNFLITETNLR